MKLLHLTLASLLYSESSATMKTWNEGVLKRHNEKRALHGGTPDMTLDDDLIAAAQKWSDAQLAAKKMSHDTGLSTGENLAYAMDSSKDFTKEADYYTKATDMWYDEIKDYDFAKPEYSDKTGHFTQVVWKDSTKLGCVTLPMAPPFMLHADTKTLEISKISSRTTFFHSPKRTR